MACASAWPGCGNEGGARAWAVAAVKRNGLALRNREIQQATDRERAAAAQRASHAAMAVTFEREVLSVADAVEELVDELPRAGRITFRELTSSFVERLEVVVRFLAVLELYKQGMVDIIQAGAFGAIQILWLGSEFDSADPTAIDVYDG